MSPLPSLRICLVHATSEHQPWDLRTLASHLTAVGHEVESCDSVGARTMAKPDVVHCFGLPTTFDLMRADADATVLLTPSRDDVASTAATGRVPALGAVAAVVRSSLEQAFVHRLGLPRSRTWVLPVAVDVDTFGRLGHMANRTERFRLVVELSGPEDGIEDVLAAMVRLDDVELVVLTAAAMSVPAVALREVAVRKAASRAGVSQRVVVVAPASPGERAWWLRSAHVAVAVSATACAADFVAEAMACGTPVVATPVDASANLVVHGVTGFRVPARDPLSLARAVRMVLQDGFTLESYGMAAADRALSRFAWPRVTDELVGVYRRVALAPSPDASYEVENLPDEDSEEEAVRSRAS